MFKNSGNFIQKNNFSEEITAHCLMRKRKLFAFFVSFITILAIVLGVVFGVSKNEGLEENTIALTGPVNTDYWTDNSEYYNTTWSGSGDTADDPYLIQNAKDLAGLAYSVNNSGNNFDGKYFKQTANIDLSDHYWRSIGNSQSYKFSGSYDGYGFTISGVFMTNGYGLFGYVAPSNYDSYIKNIGLKDSVIEGNGHIGGLIGYVFTSVNVSTNLTVTNCFSDSSVIIKSSGNFVGGLIGYITHDKSSSVTISNCYNNANIIGDQYAGGVGGIVGGISINLSATTSKVTYNSIVKINNCFNRGNIEFAYTSQSYGTGGVVGYIYQYAYANGSLINPPSASTQIDITNNFNTGNISFVGTQTSYYVGGILGSSQLSVSQTSYGTVNGVFAMSNCYNLGGISSSNQMSYVGGIAGNSYGYGSTSSSRVKYSHTLSKNYYGGNSPQSIKGINNSDRTGEAEYKQLDISSFKTKNFYENVSNWQASAMWDFDFVWKFVDAENDGFPVFIPQNEKPDGWLANSNYYKTTWQGSGNEQDPYLIQTSADLAGLSYAIYSKTAEIVSGNNYFANTYFKQTQPIDMSAHWWQPIGTDDETNFYTLYNFCGNYDGGGFTISGLYTYPGSNYQGLFGTISGATLKNINLIDGSIKGVDYVGGIVGKASSDSLIVNCSFSGQVVGSDYVGGISGSGGNIGNCSNYGLVGGKTCVGGIVGDLANVNMSNNESDIFGASDYIGGIGGKNVTAMNVYNTGDVYGLNYVGGICGSSESVNISYNAGRVEGKSFVGGIIGVIDGQTINNINLGSVNSDSELMGAIVGGLEDNSIPSLEQMIVVRGDFIFSSYYGGDCENIGGIAKRDLQGTIYSKTLAQDSLNIDFYTNKNNWQIICPWDFELVWEIDEAQNSGLPQLTDNQGVLVSVVSFDNGLLETAGWYGPTTSYALLGYAQVESKWLTKGQEIGYLPSYDNSGDLSFKGYYISLSGEGTTITSDYVVEENTTVFAMWELSKTWLDYRSTVLQKQGNDYVISSAEDLAFVAYEVSQGNAMYINASYIQTSDIDLSGHFWFPIGDETNPFSGNYNGNGYKIFGLNTFRDFYQVAEPIDEYVGLFGYIVGKDTDNKSVIENVQIVSASIKSRGYSGGVAGYAQYVKFDNCSNKANVIGTNASAGIVAVCKDGEIVNCVNYSDLGGLSQTNYDQLSQYSGGIVVFFENTKIIYCHNSGKISGSYAAGIGVQDILEGSNASTALPSLIQNCYNESIISAAAGASGIVSSISVSQSIVDNCYNNSNIEALLAVAGGIVGINQGTLTNSYNTGTVTSGSISGGIVAGNEGTGTISNCFNTGAISAWGDTESGFNIIAGGIAGTNSGTGSISNNYFGGNCSNIGGVNNTTTDGATYLPTISSDAKTEEWYQDESLWNPEYPWNIGEDWFIVEGYPTLEPPITWLDDADYYSTKLSGSGSISDPYLITSNKELAGVAYLILNENSKYKNSYYKLTTNVDMSEYYWVPIGISNELAFAGHFDGDGHTIIGLKAYPGWDNVGLFGTVIGTESNYSVIQNIKVTDFTVNAGENSGCIIGYGEHVNILNNKVSGESNTILGSKNGGIVGYTMSCNISNCCIEGNISSEGDSVGGIAGFGYESEFNNCYTTVTSTLNSNIFANKVNSGPLGAIVGGAELCVVSNCTNSGTLNSFYSSTNFQNIISVGGIIGYANNTTLVTNCNNVGTVTFNSLGLAYVAGIAGTARNSIIGDCNNYGTLISTVENPRDGVIIIGGIVCYAVSSNVLDCVNYANIETFMSYSAGIIASTVDMNTGQIDPTGQRTVINGCINQGNIKTLICSGIILWAGYIDINNSWNLGEIGCIEGSEVSSMAAGISAMVMTASFDNCYNIGNVYGNESEISSSFIIDASGEVLMNHCFNSGKLFTSEQAGISAGLIGRASDITQLTITNSACVNYVEGRGAVGLIGQIRGAENVVIKNCYANINLNCATTDTIGIGLIHQIESTSVVIENCSAIINIKSEESNTINQEHLYSFFAESTLTPEQVVKNCYAIIKNATTGTEIKQVIEDGGLDENFGYVEGMFNGLPVPKNIYLVEDYLTQTGVLEYLQSNFGVEKIA